MCSQSESTNARHNHWCLFSTSKAVSTAGGAGRACVHARSTNHNQSPQNVAVFPGNIAGRGLSGLRVYKRCCSCKPCVACTRHAGGVSWSESGLRKGACAASTPATSWPSTILLEALRLSTSCFSEVHTHQAHHTATNSFTSQSLCLAAPPKAIDRNGSI